MNPKILDVIVIGGGPGGLSVASQLSKTKLNYLILEKGEIGQSWIDMNDSLRLLSPMWINKLPGLFFPLMRSFERIPKDDFLEYLHAYVKKHQLSVQTNCAVKNVSVENKIYKIETSSAVYYSRCVVNATGYFSQPLMPDDINTDHSVKVMHCSEYKSPKQLKDLGFTHNKKILIVGKRVTGGQLLEELYDSGYVIGIVARTEIQTRVSGLVGWIKENIYYIKEYIQIKRNPYFKNNSYAIMDGGRTEQILASGDVKIYKGIDSIEDGRVVFIDGKREEYDLIIYATGYDFYVGHMQELLSNEKLLDQLDNGAHKELDGLFFIGLDNMINFKSRYLRGIAEDSKIIKNKVLDYVRNIK